MVIPGDEIVSKDIVGTLGGSTLWQISTRGGLHLIEARAKDGKREVVGAGSHKAIARHIAKRAYPEIEFTTLEKSAQLPLCDFEDRLPFWTEVVARIRKLSN